MAALPIPDAVPDDVPRSVITEGVEMPSDPAPAAGMEMPSSLGLNEREYWHDVGSQFRLRMDNLRTMHILQFTRQVSLSRWDHPNGTPPNKSHEEDASSDKESGKVGSSSGDLAAQALVKSLDEMSLESQDRLSSSQKKHNPIDPVQCLPDDILVIVFSDVPFPDIIAAQRVSRAWRSYLATESPLYRHVSFLESKHRIPLETVRNMVSMTNGRVSSIEFDGSTFRNLTPLTPIYPHLQRLVIRQETGHMSTIFHIAFRHGTSDLYYKLPSLRTAIFPGGMLLNNEVAILLTIAPNLEELECRSAWVNLELLDGFDHTVEWRLKRLRIEQYSEIADAQMARVGEAARVHLERAPELLRYLPYLEELTLGGDYLRVMDLSSNPRIRYVDFLPDSSIRSFHQPPPSLRVCLNTPVLYQDDIHPLLGLRLWQAWLNPPAFISFSLPYAVSIPTQLATALANSHNSLIALGFDFTNLDRVLHVPAAIIKDDLEYLVRTLVLFNNLRYLDISGSHVDDTFVMRIPLLSLEYLGLSRTKVTTMGILSFITKATGSSLKEINVAETDVSEEVKAVAATNGILVSFDSPKSIPIA